MITFILIVFNAHPNQQKTDVNILQFECVIWSTLNYSFT